MLAQKFGVNRSTISHALRKRVRLSVDQELECARLAIDEAGPINRGELLRLKEQEWSRMLLVEPDLGRQQMLLNLLRSVAPLLEAKMPQESSPYADTGDDERIALALLSGADREAGGDFAINHSLRQPASASASVA